MKVKKTLSLMIALLLLCGMFSFAVNASAEEQPQIVDAGYCGGEGDGTNVTWTLDSDGTLTIGGTGKMADYTFKDENSLCSTAPWGSSYDDASRIKTVVIEDGVTDIGNLAFAECRLLLSVTIGNDVSRIGDYSFYYCCSLDHVIFPDNVTVIGNYAFQYCSFPDVTIGNGVISIGSHAFSGPSNITVPANVTDIAFNAFDSGSAIHIRCYKNSAAHTIAEKNGIAYGLLDGSEEENTISGTVENLTWKIDRLNCVLTIECDGEMPYLPLNSTPWFIKRNYVHTVIIQDGVTAISSCAFTECMSLTDVIIADSVTKIGGSAFMWCRNLRNVEIGNGVEVIAPEAFMWCSNLKSITLPDSVTTIGEEAFRDCTFLESISLGNSIEHIGNWAFSSCPYLESIALPDSVISIGNDVFTDFVQYIFYSGSEEQWNEIEIDPFNPGIYGAGIHFNAVDHTPAEPVRENETPETCTEGGSYDEAIYCTQCGYEFSREHVTVSANGHTPGAAVKENVAAATCTSNGGYDEVVYCVNCPAEVSRTHVETAATGHAWGEWEIVKQASANEEGLMRRVCANDPSHVEEEIIPKLQPQTSAFQQFIERIREFFNNIIEWFRKLFRFG